MKICSRCEAPLHFVQGKGYVHPGGGLYVQVCQKCGWTNDGPTAAECPTCHNRVSLIDDHCANPVDALGKPLTTPANTWHAGIGLCAEFIERIEFLANRAALTPAEVYAMWRKYAEQCQWADQSAILSEFEDWNKEALAPAAKLTISPELARQVATAESICLGKPLDPAALKQQTERVIREFNEADCGGAFDGHQVISDADPGL